MAAKKGAVSKSAGLDELKADLKAETLKNAYIFYGEETYLRQSYLDQVREALVPAGFEEFNYHRLGGKGLSMQALQEAVEAMPMMAQHTLVTVTDLDIFKLDMSARGAFIEIISDIPEYCTVIFIYDLVAYKRDGKMKKLVAALDEHVREVEFCQQDRELLLRWIKRRFAADGHDIDAATADHLLFTCGSLMTDLLPEIGKVSAFAKGQSVTIADINAVVEPRLEARVFDMTRAITAGSYNEAAHILGELLAPADGADHDPRRRRQGAAPALHGAHGTRRGEGPLLAQAGLGHELGLPGKAPPAGGQARRPPVVSGRGAGLSGARPADEE